MQFSAWGSQVSLFHIFTSFFFLVGNISSHINCVHPHPDFWYYFSLKMGLSQMMRFHLPSSCNFRLLFLQCYCWWFRNPKKTTTWDGYKALQIMGYLPYQLVIAGFLPSVFSIDFPTSQAHGLGWRFGDWSATGTRTPSSSGSARHRRWKKTPVPKTDGSIGDVFEWLKIKKGTTSKLATWGHWRSVFLMCSDGLPLCLRSGKLNWWWFQCNCMYIILQNGKGT